MEWIRILAGPVVGAVIGYITNYIAIKMLFRPLEAKYIFGIHVPFTPGIIPRRQKQLAIALGTTVFRRFFNWDDLDDMFTADYFADEVTKRIMMALHMKRPVKDVLAELPGVSAGAIEQTLASRIQKQMVESGMIRRMALESSAQRPSAEDPETTGAGLLAANIASAYAGPIAERVERYVAEEGEEQIRAMLHAEGEKLMEQTFDDIVRTVFPDDEALEAGVRSVYLGFMKVHVRPISESVDVVHIISSKMEKMTPGEMEVTVLDIIARELRMVIWFGAFLGALIGVVNIFI